ncbi:hypothetical protein I308_100262 [Cryptococcus tetragattii IND107]|uniref:Abscisic acid G-protein coupled receptor-domain-containing protein n=1 Tax=Cryptococcus tetragattii IND107 TaxID=1296105 RepID=A0ABR3C4A2_9TREE|nr:hypothetical protein I308_04592 [Cryptococcus tetragattii IND107]
MESSDPPPVFASTFSSSPASSPILFDTFLLLLLRLVYFFISRKFLHSTINPTLRGISQPETILPSTVSIPTADSSRRAGVSSVNETEYYEETDDTGFTPVSSYPGSPAPISLALASSSNGSRREDNPGYSSSSLPSYPSQGENTIELQAVGQKLKDASSGVSRKVLQLSHGKRSGAGTKRVKKATRGLHRASRILFSVCFAEGCNLISLVIFHAIGVLNARSRQVNFSVSLHFILALILVVVPLVQCLLFTYRSRDSSSTSTTPSQSSSLSFTSRLLISLIPFTLYMFLFTRIPPYITAVPVNFQVVPTPSVDMDDPSSTASTIDEAIVQWSTSGPEGWEQGGWLAPSLGRVVVLGVVILGSLSGFGAVRSAWNFFEHRRAGSHTLTDNDLLQAERSLYRVRQDLISKKNEINRYVVPSGESSSGWMGRIFGGENNQTAALEAELRGLETMEMQVSRSLKAMKARKRRQDFGHTFRGQIYNILGYVFAVYCAARLVMCLPSLFFAPHTAEQESGEIPIEGKGNTNGDWISFFLALAISKLPRDFADIDVPTWSRGISLILTGVLILSSLTQVMRSLSKILRLTSKTVGAGFLLLSLGQLFATYVISLLIQLRTSLPPTLPESDPFSNHGNYTGMDYDDQSSIDLSQRDDSLLSTLPDFRVFGRLFDIMFLLAAATTALYRYIVLKVASADDIGDIYT